MNLTTALLQRVLPTSRLYGFVGGRQGIPVIDCHEDGINITASFAIDTRTSVYDTRPMQAGDLFIALKGSKSDGHEYVGAALERGAVALMVDVAKVATLPAEAFSVPIIAVVDTYDALFALAEYWRQQFNYPVVGVTGSLGKTTVKEMIRTICIFAGKKVLCSPDNQNSALGLALNISQMNDSYEAAIFEMGIDGKGEMDILSRIAKPTVAIITNISFSHVSKIGSVEEIAHEKKKIFSHFTPTNVGIICGDDPYLTNTVYSHPVVKYGKDLKNDVSVSEIQCFVDTDGALKSSATLRLGGNTYTLVLPNNHRGFIINALAALAVCEQLGISVETSLAAIACYKTYTHRFQPRVLKNFTGAMISDCYNANPVSMKAALDAFGEIVSPYPKIAILGNMMELGTQEVAFHHALGRQLEEVQGLEKVILVGALAHEVATTGPKHIEYLFAPTWKEAQQLLELELSKNSLFILVKSSKSIGLRYLVDEVSTESVI